MENKLVKSLIFNKQVRLFFIDNTKLVNDILALNNELNKLQRLILGKTVSAVSLLSGTLKGNQRMSIHVALSNPTHKIFVDADANGNVRGYLNNELKRANDTAHLSMEELIGLKGSIRVIKGSAMKQFTGITDMPYRNIDGDISHYFIQSEQIETFLKTNIAMEKGKRLLFSRAIYAQLLPGASIELMEDVKQQVDKMELCYHFQEEAFRNYFPDIDIIGYSEVQFSCGCSKEMFLGMLYSLSNAELKQAIQQNEPIETVCKVCGQSYHFHPSEINKLL